MRFQEAFNEFEGAAVIPMQLIAPVTRLFFEERLDLTNRGLPEIDDVHGVAGMERALPRVSYHS